MLRKKLKEMRGSRSQDEIAKKLGFRSAQYISNCERGICLPSLKLAKYLCETSKTPLEEVLDLVMHEKRREYLR